ncbi:MAG: extracellular solute-binding protein [Clostridia bacterium]|nr:extracellular solute-binding protein [Clostridia bacterium]
MRNNGKFRLAAFALCLLLLCGLTLAACGPATPPAESSAPATSAGDTSATESTPDQGGSKYQNADKQYTTENLGMPEYTFTNETEFRVCVTSNELQTTYFSEEIGYDMYDTTDTVLNEAVKTRNDLIEQKFGVTVVAVPVKEVKQAVQDDATASTNLYDAAMPFMPAAATLAQEGLLYDLTTFSDYIHLDAPWWDQQANESLSVGGHLYFTTGDISIMQKIISNAITFNKTMYDNQVADKYGDLYQLVRDHKWTFDTMLEMCKLVTADNDGEAGMGPNDTFGMSASNGDARGFYLASGEKLISKDSDDLPSLYIGSTESSISIAQKVLSAMAEGDQWYLNCQNYKGQVADIWVLSLQIFGENRALFRSTAFSAIKKLRAYTDASDFGIVPMPMVKDGQEEYCTPALADYAYGVVIPISAHNPEFSAYMLEEMCASAKNNITPAYYDVTLKHRDSKDLESEEMLDHYIFNHVVYDPGLVYNFGEINGMLTNLASQKSTDIVSTIDGAKAQINQAIDECVAAYEMNG